MTLRPAPLLAVLVAAAYATSLDVGFTMDSGWRVIRDPRVESFTSENLGLIFSKDYWWPISASGLYRPLVTLSWLANRLVLGQAPWGFHLVNLALHFACAWLVYRLAVSLAVPAAIALGAAAIFAVHPAHTEAVTNLVGRADVLATAGVLGAYVFYRERMWVPGRIAARDALLAGGLFLAALWSKEHAAVLLPFLVVHHWAERGAGRLSAWRGVALFAVPAALAFGLRAWALHDELPSAITDWDNPIANAPAPARAFAGLATTGRLLLLLGWPARLCADYSYEIAAPAPALAGLGAGHAAALAAGALAVGLLVARSRTARRCGLMLAFALLALLPTSNVLVPIGSPMAERFVYMASPGVLLAAAVGVAAAARRWPARRPAARTAVVVVAGVVVLALGVRTAVRNRDWVSDDAVWTSAARQCPGSLRAQLFLADRALERGDSPAALAAAERAVAVSGGTPLARIKLGAALVRSAEGSIGGSARDRAFERAREVLEPVTAVDTTLALGRSPTAPVPADGAPAGVPAGNPELHDALGRAYAGLGRWAEAETALARRRAMTPEDPAVHRRLAGVLDAQSRHDEAAAALFAALLLDASDAATRQAMTAHYRGAGPACALVGGPEPRVNVAGCPPVHGHLCRAYADLGAAMRGAGRDDTVGRLAVGAQQTGCPPLP